MVSSFFFFFFSFFATICFTQPSSNRAPTLVDAPIAAASITYLDGEDWLVSAVNMTIAGTVPGDVISDLQRSGLIGDPLYELNWLQQSPTWWRAWTYTKSFSITPINLEKIESGESDLLLVFDGIKMSSSISINGAKIGHTTNQFLRYSFSLSAAHRSLNNTLLFTGTGATDNTISITFDLLNDQTTEGRFMACSAGWDWAAYIWNTTTLGMSASGPTATRALTFGLWKSVYLATIETSSAAIMHVVPHVFYNGDFPVMPLSDVNNGGFTVNVRVHFWAGATGAIGMLSVNGAWLGAHVIVPINVPAGESNVSVTLNAPVGSVSLWWPAGTGGLQPLYEISAIFTPTLSSLTPITAEPRRIGFRYIALTTGNDTDAEWRAANAGGDGNANQGMMIRVNGAALMIRGANMIPQDEFEGRYDAIAFARMVKSSAEANMNLLRVWGGGVFAPSAFYLTKFDLDTKYYFLFL
jgi:beta-mannosidase